jgi:1H-pyrrole-2-carbonyl-[peptidyl-carrier protein] chlorinase
MNYSVPDFDVGIIGGGPAGSSMAAYLAKAGVSCVLFEREIMPRPHVGESLVPSSTRVLGELGFLPKMEEAKFPRKYGAAWTAAHGSKMYDHNFNDLAAREGADIRFAEREQPGVSQNYTWHVDRGKFDLMLLQHAHEFGAKVYEGVSVSGVDFDADPNFVSVKYSIGKKQMSTSCRMVVDASGRRTMVGNQMKWRIEDPVFDQYALHSWFEGYNRMAMAYKEDMNNYIFIHFLPLTNTWVWQIPITESVTSIGVVTQKKNFAPKKDQREQFFWEAMNSRPELHDALRASERVRPFREEGDYSYAMKQIAGDRVVLIGDAARFVDPIFSTGVSIALTCSRFAHKDILQALETGNFKREAFKEYEATLKRGTRNWYNFISVYYRLNILFTAFIMDPRYRVDVIKLLQGDVYDDAEPAVLTRMRNIVLEVEKNPNHVWHKSLGDLTANAFVEAAA